jgi:hypothetical protein
MDPSHYIKIFYLKTVRPQNEPFTIKVVQKKTEPLKVCPQHELLT